MQMAVTRFVECLRLVSCADGLQVTGVNPEACRRGRGISLAFGGLPELS